MELILITFGVFLLVILGMSIGYLVKGKTISGSCGGISSLGLKKVCDCPEPCDKRKAKMEAEEKRKAKLEKAGRII